MSSFTCLFFVESKHNRLYSGRLVAEKLGGRRWPTHSHKSTFNHLPYVELPTLFRL